MNLTESRSLRVSWTWTPQRTAFVCLGLMGLALQLCGCATAPAGDIANQAAQAERASVVTTYGIKIEGLRLTAAGSMLDLRYRVLDAQKAAPLLNGKIQPYLLDEARSAKLGVPDTPVLGRIRQTARNNVIHTDRTYFVMFGTPARAKRDRWLYCWVRSRSPTQRCSSAPVGRT
jgi:hypothetical protein